MNQRVTLSPVAENMKALAPEVRTYRILGFLALLHVVALLGSARFTRQRIGEDGVFFHPPFLRLWLVLTILWLLWPVVLALHRGRSLRRFSIFTLPTAVLFVPCFFLFQLEAPIGFGLPSGVNFTPWSAWKYATAYRAGRVDAKRDLAAGKLAIESYGFGAGGRYVQLYRERYQIDVRLVAGCLVDETILGHAAGYNEVAEPEIERRYGRASLEAAREEGARLDAEEYARQVQAKKDWARRLTSLPPEGKVIMESVSLMADQPLSEHNLSEEEITKFIHAIEARVVQAVPPEAPASDFRVLGEFNPTAPPRVETGASSSFPRPIYDKLREDFAKLPDVRSNKERVSYYFEFAIRETP